MSGEKRILDASGAEIDSTPKWKRAFRRLRAPALTFVAVVTVIGGLVKNFDTIYGTFRSNAPASPPAEQTLPREQADAATAPVAPQSTQPDRETPVALDEGLVQLSIQLPPEIERGFSLRTDTGYKVDVNLSLGNVVTLSVPLAEAQGTTQIVLEFHGYEDIVKPIDVDPTEGRVFDVEVTSSELIRRADPLREPSASVQGRTDPPSGDIREEREAQSEKDRARASNDTVSVPSYDADSDEGADPESLPAERAAGDSSGVVAIKEAAYTGSYGARFYFGESRHYPAYLVDETPANDRLYRLQSFFRFDNLMLDHNDGFIFYDLLDAEGLRLAALRVHGKEQKKWVYLDAFDVEGEIISDGPVAIETGWQSIEIEWFAGQVGGDEYGSLRVNDELRAAVVGFGSSRTGVDAMRCGIIELIGEEVSGFFDADDWVSFRSSNPKGLD